MTTMFSLNIYKKDYIEERLLKWARWGKRNALRLGYPTQSIEARLMKVGTARSKYSFFSRYEESNPEAEQMDKLVSSLAQYDKKVASVIKVNYIDEGSQNFKAKKMGMSLAHFKENLNIAKAWLSGCLTTPTSNSVEQTELQMSYEPMKGC